jgi:hypothetical protein
LQSLERLVLLPESQVNYLPSILFSLLFSLNSSRSSIQKVLLMKFTILNHPSVNLYHLSVPYHLRILLPIHLQQPL